MQSLWGRAFTTFYIYAILQQVWLIQVNAWLNHDGVSGTLNTQRPLD